MMDISEKLERLETTVLGIINECPDYRALEFIIGSLERLKATAEARQETFETPYYEIYFPDSSKRLNGVKPPDLTQFVSFEGAKSALETFLNDNNIAFEWWSSNVASTTSRIVHFNERVLARIETKWSRY